MFQAIKGFFRKPPTQQQLDEEYLADSHDLADLERRLRELEQRANNTHKTWWTHT